MRISIAEDEGVTAVHMKKIVRDYGHEIADVLPTAESLIKHLRKDRPGLVLMDINLAGEMDGVAATKVIRDDFDIPVVVVTAYGDPDTRTRVRESGAEGYIRKPIEPTDLGDLLSYFAEDDREKPQFNGELFFEWLKRTTGILVQQPLRTSCVG